MRRDALTVTPFVHMASVTVIVFIVQVPKGSSNASHKSGRTSIVGAVAQRRRNLRQSMASKGYRDAALSRRGYAQVPQLRVEHGLWIQIARVAQF
jgi:hypothetical protein